MGVSLFMVLALGACSASKTENGSVKDRVAKLSAQIDELAKKTDELATRIRKDQSAKDTRLQTIDNQLEDISSRLKK